MTLTPQKAARASWKPAKRLSVRSSVCLYVCRCLWLVSPRDVSVSVDVNAPHCCRQSAQVPSFYSPSPTLCLLLCLPHTSRLQSPTPATWTAAMQLQLQHQQLNKTGAQRRQRRRLRLGSLCFPLCTCLLGASRLVVVFVVVFHFFYAKCLLFFFSFCNLSAPTSTAALQALFGQSHERAVGSR